MQGVEGREILLPDTNYVIVGDDLNNVPVLQRDFPYLTWLQIDTISLAEGRWVTYGGTAEELGMVGQVDSNAAIFKLVPFFREELDLESRDLRFALRCYQCRFLERIPDNVRLFTPLPSLGMMVAEEISGLIG